MANWPFDKLIPDVWSIITGYLNETDKIKLHAFGVKSRIESEKINFRKIQTEIQAMNNLESVIDLHDLNGNFCFYMRFLIEFTPILNRKIKSSARSLHVRFPDSRSDVITVISDTLEKLSIGSKSVINLEYKTETKTKTLKTLRVTGLDCQSPAKLSGFESVERLFVSSIPVDNSASMNRLVKKLIFPKPTQIREYYGDVNICRGDTPKMMPGLQIYSIINDVADSPEHVFSIFPKLQVYVDDGFVYTRPESAVRH